MKKFCHLCGAKYIEGKEQPWVCSGCGNKSYRNDVATIKGTYDLIGGFLNAGENFEDAVTREIKEELGLSMGEYSEPVFLYSHNETYPFSKELIGIVSVVFATVLKTDKKIVPADDVEEVAIVDLDELDNYTYSKPEWKKAIHLAHKRLFS